MFAPFPQTTHHLAVVFSTCFEIPGKQVVADMLQQCVEVIWLICKRSNWCLTESQVGPIFWLFLAFRASKMRTLTNPGFGIKTKWRRGAAHNGGGATTHAPCAQKTRFFNCTKLSWLYDALTKRTLLQKMKIELDKVAFIIPMIIHISWMHGMIMFLCHIPSMVKTPNSWLLLCTVNQWTCDENQCWLQKRYNTNFYGFLEAVTGKRPCRDTELVYMWRHQHFAAVQCTVNQWACDENQFWLQKGYNTLKRGSAHK